MGKRTITISLRNWKRLASFKICYGIYSFDDVLNRLLDNVERGWRTHDAKKMTQKPAVCPNCEARIVSLDYIMSVPGEFTLDADHQDNSCNNQDSIEYRCPDCGEDLFDNAESAENFLLGKEVRPTLLEKKRTH